MGANDAAPPEPLPLDEAARQLLAAGAALGGELGGAGGALRALVLAELALSRSALIRALVLLAVAVVLGTTAWLYLMAMLALGLRALGLVWWVAVAVPGLASLVLALGCAWSARRLLDDARFLRTRRVLARLREVASAQAADPPGNGSA